MRTTLTLDEDVSVLLTRLRKSRNAGLKELVNEALRVGLRHLAEPPGDRPPYYTPSVSLGTCLVGRIDDVAGVLAVAEGESFR